MICGEQNYQLCMFTFQWRQKSVIFLLNVISIRGLQNDKMLKQFSDAIQLVHIHLGRGDKITNCEMFICHRGKKMSFQLLCPFYFTRQVALNSPSLSLTVIKKEMKINLDDNKLSDALKLLCFQHTLQDHTLLTVLPVFLTPTGSHRKSPKNQSKHKLFLSC